MFYDSFICEIDTPEGTTTYHIKNKYWNLFDVPEVDYAPKDDYYSGRYGFCHY